MARSTLSRFAVSIAALALLSACSTSDPRLQKLSAGIAKESVMVVMGGAPAHRVDQFLINSNYIEAMYFTQPGAGSDSASNTDRKLSPAILINGKLAGWGWKQWDSIAAANKVPVAPDIK